MRRPLGGVLLRVAVFAFLEVAGSAGLSPLLLDLGGYLVAAALGTFAAAAIANALAVRIWERGNLTAIGLGWTPGSLRNAGIGLATGAGLAALLLALPLLSGLAEFRRSDIPASGSSVVFVLIVLLFGAVGEELLFHGYGFQLLMGSIGRFATILPVAVIFALLHTANPNATPLGAVNTFLWGIVLGYAVVRGGDLWLPIGLHYGWNATLPLFGVNVSGFKMGMTGYVLHWNAGELWSGGAYGVEGGLLCLPAAIAALLILWRAPVAEHRLMLLPEREET